MTENDNDIKVKTAINLMAVVKQLKAAKYFTNKLKGIRAMTEFERKRISEIENFITDIIKDINNFKK